MYDTEYRISKTVENCLLTKKDKQFGFAWKSRDDYTVRVMASTWIAPDQLSLWPPCDISYLLSYYTVPSVLRSPVFWKNFYLIRSDCKPSKLRNS